MGIKVSNCCLSYFETDEEVKDLLAVINSFNNTIICWEYQELEFPSLSCIWITVATAL